MRMRLKRTVSLLLGASLVSLPILSAFSGHVPTAAAADVDAVSYPASQDAFVSDFNSQGDRLGINLSANKLIYGKFRHAYLQFDLSSIDTSRYNVEEMSMTLQFRKTHAPNELVFTESERTLRDSDEEWTKDNLTYNNRPNDIADSPVVTRDVTSNGEEDLSIDLSEIFRQALDNGRSVVSIHLTTASVDVGTVSASEMYSSRNTSGYPGPTLSVTLGEPVANDGVDRTALSERIDQAGQLNETDYTADSWAALTEALDEARTVNLSNSTQEEVDTALAALQTAMDNLEAAELPVGIAGPNMGNYFDNGNTAAMIMKMRNGQGQYVKVDPVSGKLSLTSDSAEASAFALYVLDYFATVDRQEPEVGATRTAYSIKSLVNNKYLTIQNDYTAEQFLSNTHHYFNILRGAPDGTATDRTFEIKAAADIAGWNERFYIDRYPLSDYYRIWSHLSTMRDDSNFGLFNVTMTDDTMQSSGIAAENTEYRFYFEELTGRDLLEVSERVSGDDAELGWLPVNGDTEPAHYRIDGSDAPIEFTGGKLRATLADLGVGVHEYAVHYDGDDYQATANVKVRIFNHPGLLLTDTDLDNMKRHVTAKDEPWYSAYQRLLDSVPYDVSSPDYATTVFPSVGRGGAPSDSGNIGYFEKGGNAAYFNALQWVVTGDEAYAAKAVDILDQWAGNLKAIDGRDRILGAGINAYKYASAAEIVRYYDGGYSGYGDDEFKALQDMMLNVVYPVIQDAGVPMLANGNWDEAALITMMAIGVLCDNSAIFDRASAMYRDIHVNGSIFAYVNDSGQTMETGRDQAHAQLAIGYMAELCLIAYNQNEDLYSLYDNRLAKAFEYLAKYNLHADELYGEDLPFVAMPNVFADTGRGYYADGFDRDNNGLNRGELRPVYEQGLALYAKVGGVDMTWTARAAAASRPQAMVHFDNLNFGTLTLYNGAPQMSAGPYFQLRTRWEPLYQRNWSTVNGEKVAETLHSYYDIDENGELTTSVMKQDAPFYQLVDNRDGTYSVKLLKTGTYLSVKDEQVDGYNAIRADAPAVGDDERFILRSTGVGPYFLASPKYDNRIVYQEASGSGTDSVLTLRLGTKTLSQVADVPNVTTNERLIFMYNTQEIAQRDIAPTTPPVTTPPTTSQTTDHEGAGPKISLGGAEAALTQQEDGTYRLVLAADQIARALDGNGKLTIRADEVDRLTVELPIPAMGAADLTLESGFGSVDIPNAALQSMREKYGDTLLLSIVKGSYTIRLQHEGQAATYEDPDHPLTVTLPVEVTEGRDAGEYVAIRKESGGNVILPLAVVKDGYASFTIPATGTYDVVYNGNRYDDVPNGNWASSAIGFATARGLVEGAGDNRFRPDESVTRAMFARVLANLEGADLGEYASSAFGDVPDDRWYAGAVNWAARNGIADGIGQGLFGPDAGITREQMAVMLVSYAKHKGYKLPAAGQAAFADADSVSPWASEAVKAAASAGILLGKPDGSFDPQGNATRAEMAAVFARFVQMLSSNR